MQDEERYVNYVQQVKSNPVEYLRRVQYHVLTDRTINMWVYDQVRTQLSNLRVMLIVERNRREGANHV